MNTAKIIVGSLGFLGTIMTSASVVGWTLSLGAPQNYVGAILIAFLGACSGVSCAYLIKQGAIK